MPSPRTLPLVVGLGIVLACTDPPGDGFLVLEFAIDGTGESDVVRVVFDLERTEVIVSETIDGERRRVTVDDDPPDLVWDFSGAHFAAATYAPGSPPGFIHQVRLISPDASITLMEPPATLPLAVPSGPQTGLKINAPDGDPFEVVTGAATRVRIALPLGRNLQRPPGRGFLFTPSLDGVAVTAPFGLPDSWFAPGEVFVAFRDAADIDPIVEEIGAVVVERSALGRPWVTLGVDGDEFLVAEDLEARPEVIMAAPNYFLLRNRTEAQEFQENVVLDQHMSTIHAPEAWDVQRGSRRVLVAVIDENFNPFHDELAENVVLNANEIGAEVVRDRACQSLSSPIALPPVSAGDDGAITIGDFQTAEWRAFLGLGEAEMVPLEALVDPDPSRCGLLENRVDNDGNGLPDDILGWNFSDRSAADDPGNKNLFGDDALLQREVFLDASHGNTVAGLIGAVADEESMFSADPVRLRAEVVGVSWRVGLILIRAVQGTGEDLALTAGARYADALAYATLRGATVINLSASTTCVSADAPVAEELREKFGCDAAEAEAARDDFERFFELTGASSALVTLAARNGYFDIDDPRVTDLPTETSAPNVIAVTRTDGGGFFMNDPSEETPFGPVSLDIAAPAHLVRALSLAPSGRVVLLGAELRPDWDGLAHELGDDEIADLTDPLQALRGTSFASPLVAGTAALVAASRPDWFVDVPNPVLLRRVILDSARHHDSLEGKVGNARLLDVRAALDAAAELP